MKSIICVASLSFLALGAGCAAGPESDPDPDRGPLGKGDAVGSCEGACGAQAPEGNCWCDELCEDFGDCCADKVAVCEASFVRFELFRGGFCAPEADCTSSIELLADGTLLVDRHGDPSGETHEAVVSVEDLSAAIGVLTDPALVDVLEAGEPACSQPTDIFESMTLENDSGVHQVSTTFCSSPELDAARQVLEDLANEYLGDSEFSSFRLFRSGFCAPEADCTSFIELDAGGLLRVDRPGEPGGEVEEATVAAEDLDQVIAVVTDEALLELLDQDGAPCSTPSDIFESMTVKDGAGEHRNTTTFCDLAPISAAREAVESLAAEYLPAP